MTNHGTDVGWSCYRGGRVGEVENLGVNFLLITAYRSIACLHAWLRWCTKPFSWQKHLLLGKRLLKYHNRVYNLELSSVHLGYYTSDLSIYRPNLSDIQRQSWPWPRSADWRCNIIKMGILYLAFIFCCIRSWMALHVRIKTFSPRVLLSYTRTFAPVTI
jgi:hypothetical protein